MASTYSDLKIELIGTGEQSGTWGITTNTNLGTALEEAIVGFATANYPTDADLTLTLTNTNATQVARHFALNVTSSVSLTTTRNLIVPAIEKPYLISNNTTGTQSIIVKTASGTGVTVPKNKRMMVYVDGTNVVPAFNELPVGASITGQGDIVTTTGTQTLTNKTIAFASNTLTDVASTNTAQTLTSKTLGNYTETVFAITDGATVNLDPNNGPIQTWTLGANRTPGQANWAAGQSITLQIDDGTAHTITWTTLAVEWKTDGGAAPTLQTTGFTVIVFWKVGTVIYGARVGDV